MALGSHPKRVACRWKPALMLRTLHQVGCLIKLRGPAVWSWGALKPRCLFQRSWPAEWKASGSLSHWATVLLECLRICMEHWDFQSKMLHVRRLFAAFLAQDAAAGINLYDVAVLLCDFEVATGCCASSFYVENGLEVFGCITCSHQHRLNYIEQRATKLSNFPNFVEQNCQLKQAGSQSIRKS